MTEALRDDDSPQPTPLRAVQAEVAAETGDGYITVPLVTVNGEQDLRVPPQNKWRSQARNALMSRGDGLLWAALTLSTEDAATFRDLDPDGDEQEAFFEEFSRLGGMDFQNRSARRSSTPTQRR